MQRDEEVVHQLLFLLRRGPVASTDVDGELAPARQFCHEIVRHGMRGDSDCVVIGILLSRKMSVRPKVPKGLSVKHLARTRRQPCITLGDTLC